MWVFVPVVVFAAVVAAMVLTVDAWKPTPPLPEQIIARHVRRAVVVSLKSGESFRGALEDADHDALVLVNAGSADGKPVDGGLLILRGDIAYVQLL